MMFISNRVLADILETDFTAYRLLKEINLLRLYNYCYYLYNIFITLALLQTSTAKAVSPTSATKRTCLAYPQKVSSSYSTHVDCRQAFFFRADSSLPESIWLRFRGAFLEANQ
jgi:hypothetical protein